MCQKGLVAADSALAHDAQSLLTLVTRRGASDLHLSVGRPPILRIDGRLEPQAMVPVSASDLDALLRSIMSCEQRARFAENMEQALEDLVRRGAIDKDEAVRYMQVAGNADKSRPKPPA